MIEHATRVPALTLAAALLLALPAQAQEPLRPTTDPLAAPQNEGAPPPIDRKSVV